MVQKIQGPNVANKGGRHYTKRMMEEILHQLIWEISDYSHGLSWFYTSQVAQDFFHQQYDRFFVLINMFGGDCLKPGWIFMKHQQDSTEVCGCGDKVLLLAQIKDFRFLGFDNCCILSISSPKFVSSTWPAPGHFSPIRCPPFPLAQATANHDNPAGWKLKYTVAKGV